MNPSRLHGLLLAATLLPLSLTVTGCVGPVREIRGTLVEARSGSPVPNQTLVLTRPPGAYPNIAILVTGEVGDGPIARTRTDDQGRFRILTRKGKGRGLLLVLGDMPLGTTGSQVSAFRIKPLSDSEDPPGTGYDYCDYYDRQHRVHFNFHIAVDPAAGLTTALERTPLAERRPFRLPRAPRPESSPSLHPLLIFRKVKREGFLGGDSWSVGQAESQNHSG